MNIENNVTSIIKETKESFSEKVEEFVWMNDVSYLDAIAELTKDKDVDKSFFDKLLTPTLRAKVTEEALKLSLIKSDNKNRLF